MRNNWNWSVKFMAVGAILFVAGCATIVSGTHQDVSITSTPTAATVSIDRSIAGVMESAFKGATPAVAGLKRKYDYVLNVTLDGYEPAQTTLESSTNGWIWGNLIFAGIIGAIVDFTNGAAKKLEPNEIHIELISVSSASIGSKPDLYAVFSIKGSNGKLTVSPVKMIPLAD